MSKIFVEYEQNVPILRFSECKHCKMPYGKRHPSLPNRGCCWYDAEFDLFDAKNIIDKNMDRWTDIITHYPYELIVKEDVWLVRFYADCFHGKTEKEFKICQFFQENKGCLLPVFVRPFICRITLCPQAKLNLHPTDYQQIRAFIGQAYKYRLSMLDAIMQFIKEEKVNIQNIQDVTNALKNMSPLPAFEEVALQVIGKTGFNEG